MQTNKHMTASPAILIGCMLLIAGCDQAKKDGDSGQSSAEPQTETKADAPAEVQVATPATKPSPAPTEPHSSSTQPSQPPSEHKAIVTEKLEPYECGDIKKLHTYGGIFLASQPQPADFEQAKKGGVKTVINMRHPSEINDFDEQQLVADLGLAYHNPAWNGPEELTDEVFDQLRELLKTEEKPILLHCSSANRVGPIWMVYRVLDNNLSTEEALAEAKIVGMKSPDYEAMAIDYINRRGQVSN